MPLTLIVAGPPTGVDFTYSPTAPWMNEDVTFNGTATALLPVDYAWSFGDGAYGAGQNPTHAYAAAGTYTVIMTATQCGFETVVTDTVTVVQCWSLLTEDFEGTFPPTNWQVVNNGGTCVWTRNDAFATARPNYAGGQGFCADADSDKCGSGTTMDTELRTMVLDLSTATTATLKYVTSYNDIATGGDYADVDASIDGGTTWTNLLHWDADHSPNGPGEAVTLDLTQFQGEPSVMLRFHYWIGTYDWWWEVDQVQVGACIIPDAVPDIVVDPLSLTPDAGGEPDGGADVQHRQCGPGGSELDARDAKRRRPSAGGLAVGESDERHAERLPRHRRGDHLRQHRAGAGHLQHDGVRQLQRPRRGDHPGQRDADRDRDAGDRRHTELAGDNAVPGRDRRARRSRSATKAPGRWCGACRSCRPDWLPSQIAPANALPVPASPGKERPVITSPDQCAQYENYTGAEPIGAAEFCGTPALATLPSGGILAPTDPGYALDIGYVSDNFVTFPLNNFTGQTVLGLNATPFYGMDFDPSGTVLYALNDTDDTLGTINLTNGAYTALVPCPAGGGAANWTGLAIDPVSGVFYGATATNLYIIDPTTGSSTLVGAFGTTTMIAIAVNAEGQMYGHDITSDSIYQIDPTTGVATLIGLTGYAANYAQGMDFDNDDGTLYIFLYIGSGSNVYGTVNLTTGAVTPLAVSAPLGEFEGATQTTAVLPDVPWLTEVPTNSVLMPGECVNVAVMFDSDSLPDGVYTADLLIESNDADEPEVTIPVTLTVGCQDIVVTPPSLEVTLCQGETEVMTLTICNDGPLPLTWELSEVPAQPLGGTQVKIPAGPASAPEGTASAAGPYKGRPAGSYTIERRAGIDVPPNVLLLHADDDASVIQALLQAYGDLGSVDVYNARTSTPTLAELQAYDVVVTWSNYIYGDTTAIGNVLADYVDGGGKVINMMFAMGTHGWQMGGRFMSENYTAMNGTSLSFATICLGTYNAGHPIMAGVTNVCEYYRMTGTYLTAGSSDIAQWADGLLFVAAKDNQTVVSINGYVGYNYQWTGQMPDVVHNAILWLATPTVGIPWLSEEPISGTVPAGECVDVAATFDSDSLPAGVYTGTLFITSNDPDEPLITIPVTMTVLEAPSDADFLWSPLQPVVGETVYFSGTVAGGSAPLTWSWAFGDGGTATGQYATHAYAAPGDYLVTLTVENGCGQDVVEYTVTVIGNADIVVTPSSLAAALCPDATETMTVTICNEGDAALVWELVEAEPVSKLNGSTATPAAASKPQPVELKLEAAGGASVETNPPVVDAPVTLILDDGSRDNDIGLGGTIEMLWVNRFTPAAGEFPFTLNQIQIYFSSVGLVNVGDDIVLLVYENTSGNADPAVGSNLLAAIPTAVQALDTWNVYDLATPIALNGPGDVLIGAIGMETPGTSYWPASMDQTTTQARSWAGWWNASPPPTPPLLPPENWTLIDAYFPGNWMVRGYGDTAPEYDIPWLSEDPTSGTVPPGECVDVAVTFDSTGMAPGIYNGNLVITSNDPDTPEVTIPVQMTVLAPPTGANFTWVPTTPWVGEMIDFTGSVAAGALPLTWHWNFDDGTTAGGQSVLHAFTTPGDHLVTLTVTNGCGQMVIEHMVTVRSYYNYYYLPIVFRNYAPEK